MSGSIMAVTEPTTEPVPQPVEEYEYARTSWYDSLCEILRNLLQLRSSRTRLVTGEPHGGGRVCGHSGELAHHSVKQ